MKKINVFFESEVVFDFPFEKITEEEINNILPGYFNGKDFFIEFYTFNNGGYFSEGACFYRDVFYEIKPNDYNRIGVESFYYISKKIEDDGSPLSSSLKVKALTYKNYPELRAFLGKHFPFAGDSGSGDYWIDIVSGEIKYVRLESLPLQIVTVAPTFCDFCLNIRPVRESI
ncbi:SMI1/KNR4 family protein [Salmonella enterica subsp. enterica]|nr:SMI1/KNR4 family protein [Salmonella enterica subsp. enterica serovar Everleigh]ECD5052120.1 SMI1/KNR4 family protein [Salmonella enterica subsp. enterica serovar Everleigh]